MKSILVLMMGLSMGGKAFCGEDHTALHDACKAECPAAQTESEAEKCMEALAEKKKADKKFRKSDCFAAYRDHQKHSREEGHSH